MANPTPTTTLTSLSRGRRRATRPSRQLGDRVFQLGGWLLGLFSQVLNSGGRRRRRGRVQEVFQVRALQTPLANGFYTRQR